MTFITTTRQQKPGHTESFYHQKAELKRGVFLGHTLKGKKGRGRWEASDLDETEANIVWPCLFKDIDPNCDSIELPFKVDWSKLISSITVFFESKPGNADKFLSMAFNFESDFENWAMPYSIKEFADAIRVAAAKSNEKLKFLSSGKPTDGFSLKYPVRSSENTLRVEAEYWCKKIKILYTEVTEQLLKNVRSDSLVTFFKFPAPIRNSCQQYLIYFVQFLEDLGIKADSEIKEDAGRVLFSVTPKDGPSALGNIKDALEAYLSLPRDPAFNTAAGEFSDMAVSQLTANVFFLKSQLALVQAVLETKNATIEALNFTIFQQRQLLTGPGLSEDAQESKKGSEPILGDTVHLTKYEGKFLKVDLPTILRRLKRSFGIEKDKE